MSIVSVFLCPSAKPTIPVIPDNQLILFWTIEFWNPLPPTVPSQNCQVNFSLFVARRSSTLSLHILLNLLFAHLPLVNKTHHPPHPLHLLSVSLAFFHFFSRSKPIMGRWNQKLLSAQFILRAVKKTNMDHLPLLESTTARSNSLIWVHREQIKKHVYNFSSRVKRDRLSPAWASTNKQPKKNNTPKRRPGVMQKQRRGNRADHAMRFFFLSFYADGLKDKKQKTKNKQTKGTQLLIQKSTVAKRKDQREGKRQTDHFYFVYCMFLQFQPAFMSRNSQGEKGDGWIVMRVSGNFWFPAKEAMREGEEER